MVRTPRLLRPVQQVLKDDAVYVYHTKINTKPAIEGTVWQWHQDYGSWMRDGCARPDMEPPRAEGSDQRLVERASCDHRRHSERVIGA